MRPRQEASSFTWPSDPSRPLYGEKEETYGSSGHPVRRCLICSSPENVTFVLVANLAEHAARHVASYATYLAEEAGA
jgi:hypothetical protein